MKATEITPNITQLTRLHFVNAYLVREDDGFTLVDTTMGGAADSLIAAAADAGGSIRRIALTHGHGDHVGSLDALKERLDGVEHGPQGSLDKLLMTWTEQAVGHACLAVAGTSDADALEAYMYSRAQSVMGGTSQIQKNIIAGRILGLGG